MADFKLTKPYPQDSGSVGGRESLGGQKGSASAEEGTDISISVGEGKGDGGGNDGKDSRGGKKSMPLTMAKTSLVVIAQSTGGVVIGLNFPVQFSSARGFRVGALGMNLVGFVFCMAAICQSHSNTRYAETWDRLGALAAALGFILMIAINLPIYLFWMIPLAGIALLAIFIKSFSK